MSSCAHRLFNTLSVHQKEKTLRKSLKKEACFQLPTQSPVSAADIQGKSLKILKELPYTRTNT
jgi:hypothetical protein